MNRYVALKILTAKPSARCQELHILKSLDQGINHTSRNHVQQLLDHFEHKGPKGNHQCLVLELMGRNFNDYLFQFEYSLPYERGKSLPLTFKRHLCKQMVMALDYLHGQGIMHRDIHQGNILFALHYQIDEISEDEVQSELDALKTNIRPMESECKGSTVKRSLMASPITY